VSDQYGVCYSNTFLKVCPGAGIFEPHWTNFWHPPGSRASKDSPSPADGVGHYALLDINVTHPIRCTQLAISRWLNPLKDSKVGKVSTSNPKRVVHISSIAGQAPSLTTPLYIASKHAISGFIRSLAQLDTLGIRVNGVAPVRSLAAFSSDETSFTDTISQGVIKTPLWTDHPEKMKMVDENRDEWVEPEVGIRYCPSLDCRMRSSSV
jgi:NAD(P)-dependent dehydrogenase (short-subunit alcohol dehydrogenase family)